MANDIVSGLFGMSPYDTYQQQNQQADDAALQYAKLDPVQRAMYSFGKAGTGLAQAGAGMLGIPNQAVEQAKMREQVMASGGDLTTSKGLLAKAEQFRQAGDIRTATALTLKGKEMEREEAKAALAIRKQDFQEDEMYKLRKFESEERVRQNDEKIRDVRTNTQERNRLISENNQIKLMIAQMMRGSGMSAGEMREQKYKDVKDKEAQDKITAAKSGIDTLDAVKRNILDLYDEKTEKLKPAASTLFGRVDQFRGPLTLSEGSANALSSLTALKDQITMTNLADAKKMVGQSFGSMQVQEWDKFVRLLSSLDRSIGEEKAAANLKYIYDFITKKSDLLNVALGVGKPPAPSGSHGTPALPPGFVADK